MTVEQEALLFAEQNGFSAPLTAGIKLRAKVVGGDAISKAFLAAANRMGLSLNYDSQQLTDGRSDSYISKARGMLYQIFQKAETNDRMGLSIRLLLGTGMRMQELLALEPQFIEEDGSVIHIRQAVKVVKGTVSIGSPKSKDSIRDIPVPLNVRPCAIKLRDTTDQFIWESPKTGLPCNPTHFRDVFRKSLEEAGDVRLLTPHSCRHTYVSQMQALGVDIQTIQSIVGHADTEMTDHYLHVQESIRQSAIQLFSEAFSA